MGQAQDTNTANYWTSKASSYYSEKSYDLALDSVNKALNLDPTNEGALNLKGNILIGLGKFDEAITVFNKVLSRNDRNKAAWKGKGFAFSRLGRFRDAVQCYEEVLNIDDTDAEGLYYQALVLR
jgi:tetratricopeptide (TPR) repeat protein